MGAYTNLFLYSIALFVLSLSSLFIMMFLLKEPKKLGLSQMTADILCVVVPIGITYFIIGMYAWKGWTEEVVTQQKDKDE